jgi:hypothetical protein
MKPGRAATFQHPPAKETGPNRVVWFKVDDRFHSHPKAIAAGPEAIGLWTIAGSWSVDHLTDGFISRETLPKLLPNRNRTWLANRLVAAGLWEKVGDAGWQFHDWGDDGRQKTSQQVRAERAAGRERQARWREGERNAVSNAPVTQVVTRESHDSSPHLKELGVGAVTEPRGRHSAQPVDNPYFSKQTRPADSPAGRHPSARPLAEAEAAAGISPNGQPARGDTVAGLAEWARQAMTPPDPP